jgi:tetratricopeptide (TPR) repeat protein
VDPLARLYLGRALNVRFLVLGTVQSTPGGLQVVAHLLDTETGAEVNTAAAVARDRTELKCRLGEIARWLLLDPAERSRREFEASQSQALLAQAETAAKQSNFSLAIELTRRAGRSTPSIRVEVLLNQFDRDARYAALEAQQRAAWEQNQALAAAATRRQQELASAAEAARIAARQQAAADDAAERRRQRDLACQQLLVQARAASDAQNFAVAVQLYDSILAIDRKSEAVREREKVQMQAADRARAEVAVDTMRREAALRLERAADADRVRVQLDAERQQRVSAEQARRQARDQADAREYARLLDDAQRLQAKGEFDSAIRALQTAKRLRPTEEVDRLLTAAMVQQARATPPPKPAAPVPPPPAFTQQMQVGAALEKQEKFADALKAYQAALGIVSTDQAAIKRADYTRHMDAGLTALKAGKKPDAAREFEAALKTAPNDPAATKWLQQARR